MINKILTVACMAAAFMAVSSAAQAASVKCSFMSETQISSDGTWLKTENDFMKLIEIFGDGLELPLENSLLGNLDTKLPFFAGETERGQVYLMGGPIGVAGKNISVEGDVITIYDGMCTISFG